MREYNPFDKMTFTSDRCFLCGIELTDENRTKEHIYPKWLQHKFNLWNDSLVLLNHTDIKYKDLTIPCCRRCNGIMSAKIEKPIQTKVDAGYDEFIKCDRTTIFQWLNKIAYGILFKETSLKLDRSNPGSGSIYSAEELKEHKMQYTFLKSIISDTKFHQKPYSILIFKIKNAEPRYWAWENPFLHTFCIQMNDIGIISCLMDNGFNEAFFLNFEKQRGLLERHIHPVQFLEICSMFVYKVSLLYKKPFYITNYDKDGNPTDVISFDISGDAFDDWDQEEYSKIYSALLRDNNYALDVGKVYQGNGLVASTLWDENGKFYDIPL